VQGWYGEGTRDVEAVHGMAPGASGGGVSKVFAKPAYQSAITATGRAVPDVAALGDPQTGLLVGQTHTFPDGARDDEYRIGGTSLSSPIFAGIMALADQAAGHRTGSPTQSATSTPAPPTTSARSRQRSPGATTSTASTPPPAPSTLDDYSGSPTQHTSAGWDNVTGLGTPTNGFLAAFAN
jgi:subtilase family serine protease